MPATYQLGWSAKLYYGAENAAIGILTELDSIKDLTMTLASDTTDVTTRANAGWKATVKTLKSCSITFQLQWNTGDAGFEAIRDAYLSSGDLLRFAVMDQDKAVVGAQGILADFSITNFTRNEAITDAIVLDVTMELATFGSWSITT